MSAPLPSTTPAANEKKKPVKSSIFKWSLSAEQLAEQVNGYHTLKFHKTCRGVAVIVVAALTALTVVFTAIGGQSWSTTLWATFIYGLLAVFMYRGSKTAMILTMVLWTADKVLQVYYSGGVNVVSIFFWWIVPMAAIYPAVQVENARKKLAAGKGVK